MRKPTIIIIFSLILITLPTILAGQGYKISINIKGLKDTNLYFAYHLGDKQYLRDTIRLNSSGSALLEGSTPLPGGIYMVVLPGQSYFEVLIGEDQIFDIKCNVEDPFNTLEFSGSLENRNFINHQRRWVALNEKAGNIRERINANRMSSDSIKVLEQLRDGTEKEMKVYLRSVADENSGNLLAMLVKAMIPVEIPDFESDDQDINIDSLKWVNSYLYNRDHFFDNIDLSDERILRTPILHSKLSVYFKNLIIQSPDSLIVAVDYVVELSQTNYKVFQYVSVFLFNHFRESEIMGHDGVLVHIADQLYLSGKADWVTAEFKADLKKQVDRLRPSLIGTKGTDLVMNSQSGKYVSLYDIKREFTIIYFWEPDCGHCKEATPLLKEFYDKNKGGDIEVFAICTQPDRAKWEKYIADYNLDWINGWDPERTTHFDYYYNVTSTPLVYILNRNKEIIAKRISVESIESFLENYRRFYKLD